MRLYGSMATDGNIWEIHDDDDDGDDDDGDDDDANFDMDNKYQTHGKLWEHMGY